MATGLCNYCSRFLLVIHTYAKILIDWHKLSNYQLLDLECFKHSHFNYNFIKIIQCFKSQLLSFSGFYTQTFIQKRMISKFLWKFTSIWGLLVCSSLTLTLPCCLKVANLIRQIPSTTNKASSLTVCCWQYLFAH